ncbi:MAG: LamG domain-containing protein, partial [Planctomycetota bacterium]
MTSGEWTHIAVTFDVSAGGNNRKIYVNGELIAEDRSTDPLDTNADNLLIGADAYSTTRWHWHGMLDDFRIYDTALTQAEIEAIGEGQALPQASGPNPRNGSMLEAKWANLSWRAGDFAVSHDVYIGESFDDVNDGAEGTFAGNQALASLVVGFTGFPVPGGLVPGTTYYWRVNEVNDADPNSPWKGDVWSFWIQPNKAYEPDPADGANFVMTDATLTWTPGFGATLQYVYFGDNFDDVSNATGALPQTDSTYTPAAIEKGKTYYWRVDEFDSLATHTGDVWSFSTIPAIEIGDPNLVAWWMLDEGSGTIAVDSSGYDHHATIGGSPTFVPGYDGDALDFDGRSVYIDMDDPVAEGTFTCTMWLKPRDIPYASG